MPTDDQLDDDLNDDDSNDDSAPAAISLQEVADTLRDLDERLAVSPDGAFVRRSIADALRYLPAAR